MYTNFKQQIYKHLEKTKQIFQRKLNKLIFTYKAQQLYSDIQCSQHLLLNEESVLHLLTSIGKSFHICNTKRRDVPGTLATLRTPFMSTSNSLRLKFIRSLLLDRKQLNCRINMKMCSPDEKHILRAPPDGNYDFLG